jgi:hypothetical protein
MSSLTDRLHAFSSGAGQVNVPLREKDLERPRFLFTRVFNNSYSSLFKPVAELEREAAAKREAALPDAARPAAEEGADASSGEADRPLSFKFAPVMDGLVNPDPATLPEGTDTWCVDSAASSGEANPGRALTTSACRLC